MVGSDENTQGVIRPSNLHGGMGNNRRALSTINGNIGEAPQYPCKVQKKNGISDVCSKNVDGDKNLIHRPITRKYAAQVAGKQQQPTLEVLKPPVQTIPNRNEREGPIIIDVEDYKATSDYVVPMSVQHTDAMMDEIDRMDDEIEMEDVEDTLIVDIDSADKKKTLAVVEYIDDIHAYYKKIESSSCAPPNYMEQQFDINERMRAILVDWLIEVHYKFELMEETLYLTINLIDRFLTVQPVVRKKLQLVGVTAMFLACKYEEVSIPVVQDLILISDKAYTGKEVLEMEKLMINTLQFNLSVPTAYVFMKRFLKAAQSDKKVELLSFFMTELCLVEYETLRFPPSMLAAAAIFTAQCTLGVAKEWTKTCEKYSNYTRDQLLECSKLMVTFHQKAATGRLTGVHRKYSISKYGFVAKFPPAAFLLEGGKGGGSENRVPSSHVQISAGVHNRDLWSSINSKYFYGCSNASSKFAKAKDITRPNRYLLIVTSGGLNQQRTGITDAVVAARILNATLVVPKLDKTSFWKDSSDFSDIFDVDWFIKHLTPDVTIIKDLPLRRGQIWTPNRMRVPRKCSEKCYINRVLPVLMKRHAVQISKFDYRLSNKLDTDLQKLRCRVNYHALKFADPILKMGEKLVQRMRMSSKHYIALHLRFEPDMLAFSGCYYGGGDKERTELGKIRRRWKTLHNSNPEKARRQGRCPLTPEEVGLMLRALGYGKDVHIYVASGEVYGGEETLAPLKALFPNFYSKDTIASKEELEPFSAYSSRMAALDFIVCDESDVFVTNNNGNMAKILAGRRRYFGHKPSIRPNAKKLNRVFLNRNNMTSEEFSSRVHTFQRGFMGDPKEVRPGRGEFHENPSSCICEDAEAEKKMGLARQKIGKDSAAKKKDSDDMKKDVEAVAHDENVDDEPDMADLDDEDEEDNPLGEVSLGSSKVETLSNGTSPDYDPSMSEDTELDELLSD